MKRILISRTDNLGDVILTLPLATLIKRYSSHPCEVVFLGKSYTKPILEGCTALDGILTLEELSISQLKGFDTVVHVFPNKHVANLCKKAKIPLRIGTSHRLFHWWTCNALVPLSRKKSALHEAQLNIKLAARHLGLPFEVPLDEISQSFALRPYAPLDAALQTLVEKAKQQGHFLLIVHPKSKGSAREWPVSSFIRLIRLVQGAAPATVFLTGTAEEMPTLLQIHKECPATHVLGGKVSLAELMTLTGSIDGFLSNSTGPLHLAGALGKYALGLYPPLKAMTPQRWGVLGTHAQSLTPAGGWCATPCTSSQICQCMMRLSPEDVAEKIIREWILPTRRTMHG